MKKLIFIDNDDKRLADKDLYYVQQKLKYVGHLSDKYIKSIKTIPDFHRLEKEKVYDIIFEKENAICSWSMYTATHFGSLFQLTSLLRSAGSNNVRDLIYMDCSNELAKSLHPELTNGRKDVFEILNAIETNYIITFDYDKKSAMRMRVDLKGVYEDPFKFEPIDLKKLLK